MSEIIKNRSELLFCYDVTDANPNGDPLDENKPRIDEEAGINFVTDVRLKRTIRDYLFEHKGFNGKNGQDIFVREKPSKKNTEKGGLQDGKERADDFEKDLNTIINKCIDIRMFGGVIPLDKASITFTGPTQFKIGRSLHKVEMRHIQGTGAFASTAGKTQKTFREEYILPYSFIAFHGIINQNAAKHTKMTTDDEQLLLEGMWLGTKNLISRSKFGQMPRLLIKVNYKTPNFFIGDLDKKIKLTNFDNELKIRSIKDFKIDLTDLLSALSESGKHIESVEYFMDSGLDIEIPSDWNKLNM